MKYIIYDAASRVILTHTEDTRISTSLKSVLFDVETSVVYPGFHNFYHTITADNIKKDHLCIFPGHLQLKLPNEVPDYINSKKELALKKQKLVRIMFLIAERPLSACTLFFHPAVPALINNMVSLKESLLLDDYINSRGIPKDQALKELQIKVESFNHTLIKVQSTIDYFMEQITVENDFIKLDAIEKEIFNRMIG